MRCDLTNYKDFRRDLYAGDQNQVANGPQKRPTLMDLPTRSDYLSLSASP